MQNQFIMRPEDGPTEVPVQSTGYKIGGDEVDSASPGCVAKKSFNIVTNTTRYWIKVAVSGMEAGKFYNPQSPMFEESYVRRVVSRLGSSQYEFKTVTQEAFDLYLGFLKTGSLVNLRNAERV